MCESFISTAYGYLENRDLEVNLVILKKCLLSKHARRLRLLLSCYIEHLHLQQFGLRAFLSDYSRNDIRAVDWFIAVYVIVSDFFDLRPFLFLFLELKYLIDVVFILLDRVSLIFHERVHLRYGLEIGKMLVSSICACNIDFLRFFICALSLVIGFRCIDDVDARIDSLCDGLFVFLRDLGLDLLGGLQIESRIEGRWLLLLFLQVFPLGLRNVDLFDWRVTRFIFFDDRIAMLSSFSCFTLFNGTIFAFFDATGLRIKTLGVVLPFFNYPIPNRGVIHRLFWFRILGIVKSIFSHF